MAAPSLGPAAQYVDREGLTPSEYEALNLLWEDATARRRAYDALVRAPLSEALPFVPAVLFPLVIEYLSPPQLPPALLAQIEAKRAIEEQLSGLWERQQSLRPALEVAANSAHDHLAFRLEARQRLHQRARDLQAQAQLEETAQAADPAASASAAVAPATANDGAASPASSQAESGNDGTPSSSSAAASSGTLSALGTEVTDREVAAAPAPPDPDPDQ